MTDEEHVHTYEPIEDWQDPTGEAPIDSPLKRRVMCTDPECWDLQEEVMPKEDFEELPEGLITNDSSDSLGIGPSVSEASAP